MWDLSGMRGLENLRELYCSYNYIEKLDELIYLDHLEVLDLEANKVAMFDELNNLWSNTKLTNLTLEWNPISFEKGYRKRVARMLEQINYIDDFWVGSLDIDKSTRDRLYPK